MFHSTLKKLKCLALLAAIVLCNGFLLGPRNVWQLSFHVSVAVLSTALCVQRRLLDRDSECAV